MQSVASLRMADGETGTTNSCCRQIRTTVGAVRFPCHADDNALYAHGKPTATTLADKPPKGVLQYVCCVSS